MLFIHFSASPEVLVVHFCSTLGHPEVKKLLVLMGTTDGKFCFQFGEFVR